MQPHHPTGRRVAGAMAFVLLALGACAETAGEIAAGAAPVAAGPRDVVISEDGSTVSYRTPAGEVRVGAGAALPQDFPGDVYLPARYAVASTLAMDDDLFVDLDVDQDVPLLYATARKAMAGHGWTETLAALQDNRNGLLTFEKDDRLVVLSLSRESGGTRMGLQFSRTAP